MELKGTVVNVVPFGAFVDIGLRDTGLVHISRMANKFIKNPYEVVGVGDVVAVWVVEVDKDRKRASLTMVQPGSERKPEPRPAASYPPSSGETKVPTASSWMVADCTPSKPTGVGPEAVGTQPARPAVAAAASRAALSLVVFEVMRSTVWSARATGTGDCPPCSMRHP